MIYKIAKKSAMAIGFALAIGGGWLISCALEASVDSPSGKSAALVEGMPEELTVYEPQITFEGNTSVLTYKVAALPSGGLEYTAKTLENPEPQSIEALIVRYGVDNGDGGGLFQEESDANATAATYGLRTDDQRFVVIPLDTELIKKELHKKGSWGSVNSLPPLAWVEDNKVGIAIEYPDPPEGGVDGVYVASGIRVWGLPPKTTSADGDEENENEEETPSATGDEDNVCDIANFDEGDPDKNQPISIATVLVAGETSTISFYFGPVVAELSQLKSGEAVKKWMESGSATPGVRVVYTMEK